MGVNNKRSTYVHERTRNCIIRWLVFFLSSFHLFGCNINETKEVTPGFTAEVQEILFRTCINCHAYGNSEGDFGVVNSPESMVSGGYLVPGDAANSTLYRKLTSSPPSGERMPLGGPYLSDTELSVVASWINSLGSFTVTISGENVSVLPSGPQSVIPGQSISTTVTANEGFTINQTPGGTCPVGSWASSTYTTGAITEDCTLIFSGSGLVDVTPVVGQAISNPDSAQQVEVGSTLSFTVTSNTSVDTVVGGTCPEGSWNGSIYTTGEIVGSCSVAFTVPGEYAVTPILSFMTTNPAVPTIVTGGTQSYTMTANSGYDLPTVVGGTCQAGSFSGASYTTGVINSTCTVELTATTDNPCAVVDTGVTFSDIQEIVAKFGCTGCHHSQEGGKANFASTEDGEADYDLIVNGDGKVFATSIVTKGDPLASWFYTTTISTPPGSLQRMPKGGANIDGVQTYLTDAESAAICNWIYYDAPNN